MLVGREAERRTIRDLLAGARVGDSHALVLCGEAGIGKTALLAEAEPLAEGMRVLRAQGVESERLIPFAGLLQLLRPVLPLLDHIPGPQADALSSALLLGPAAVTEPSRFAVGAATLTLLARAAEDRPVAVLIDDGHLVDSPSAEALLFATRRLVTDAVAILVGVRADEPGSALWTSLPTLVLTGLDLDEAAELLASRSQAVRREQLVRLHAATAGNPLALLELSDLVGRAGAAPADAPLPVSERLSRSFLARVEKLGDDARAALLVASTDSTSAATVREACALLGVPETGLAEAQDAGLVAVRDDHLEFRHPLVRSAVYGAAAPPARRAVHRALAKVLPRDQTDRLAWHLAESAVAPDEATAAVLDEVASSGAARGAFAIASDAQERAADLTGTAERIAGMQARRLVAAGESAWLAGLTDRAMRLLDRALDSRPDALLRVHVQELRGAVETRSGSLETAARTLLEAATAVQGIAPDRAIRLFADAIHVAVYRADPATAMRACSAIEGLLDSRTDPRTRVLGSMASGMAMVLNGSGSAGIDRIRDATYELVGHDDVSADRFRLPLRVQGALWLRDAGPHRDLVTDAVDRLRQRAALGSLPYLLWHTARDAATSDRWDDAEATYLEAIRLAQETGQSTDLAVSLAGLAILNARQGRAERCHENTTAAEELCRRYDIRLGSCWVLMARGDLASGAGALPAAVAHYEALEAQLDRVGLVDPDQSCAPELVEAYVHLGRNDDARRVAQQFALKATAKGQPWALARARRTTALCASDRAEQEFRAALELHAQTPDRYETARTQLAYGAWLRRSRRRVDARPVLGAALRAFEELGADPWADQSVHELRATGQTARRREVGAMEELTPQERQIAQLLARGRTTREAAAALFISPKTVEYHLRHVYQKLGIRSRTALAERFER